MAKAFLRLLAYCLLVLRFQTLMVFLCDALWWRGVLGIGIGTVEPLKIGLYLIKIGQSDFNLNSCNRKNWEILRAITYI